MRTVLLGPVGARADDGTPTDIGGVRLRMLLARLALEAGRPVSVDALVDGLWGTEPPAEAGNALQALVSRLRKALRGVGTLESVAGGYRLVARQEDVEAHRFEELAGRGRRELAAGRLEAAASTLDEALGLWRGAALADVREAPFARAAASRLDGLRDAAAEDRYDAELRLGRHADVLADLEAARGENPLSERLAGLRMRALSAAGRQSDALAVYEETRGRLGEELGVDPSPELRGVHLALLRGELKAPAAVWRESATHRLPARLTSFVGRERELDTRAELLATCRLVTIVGFGGAGKTRLSVEAVSRHRAHGRGRVWFVPLAGVGPGDRPADAVLGALSSHGGRLGQRERPGGRGRGRTALPDAGDGPRLRGRAARARRGRHGPALRRPLPRPRGGTRTPAAHPLGFHPSLPLLRMSQLADDPELRDRGRRQALNSPGPWVRASAHWAHDFVLTEQGDLDTGADARR
ncbi:hypothetical protein GPZ77_04475 [Streptomyces sp. QHH-9511]|uniref:AfsR/SARP family transcriptional regulator n=1 Tax=Streptomyces sp. QHH-9511 TaxID=2684468 RepID=UPI0013190E8C|nr:AfsR/SARP family transcriptional regulator [Streptomyces sp. QHH-9511]QGZ47739.1 hypothetical protein GPZ77_04475 [Streptomyces sp. QHH-9511]